MAAKQSSLTLSKKLDILATVEKKNTTKTPIAQKFDIAKTTLLTILKNKDKIKEAFKQPKFESGRMRFRTAAYEDLEKAFVKWIIWRSKGQFCLTSILLITSTNFNGPLVYFSSRFNCTYTVLSDILLRNVIFL